MSKKVVLITGAARGLGNAIAATFQQHQFEVIATDINYNESCEAPNKEPFATLKLDVTSETDMLRCSKFVKEKYGRLDILISNAGIFDFYPVTEAGAEQLGKIMDVNFFGLANLVKHFLPLILGSKGRLIVIGSESYKVPAPFQPYAISKQALESLFNAISIELSLKSIRSVLIRPGAIDTNILEETLHFKSCSNTTVFEKEFSKFIKAVPAYINRVSSAQKVARLVYRASTKKKPKRVYSVNHNPLVTLLSLMPNKVKNFVLKRSLA